MPIVEQILCTPHIINFNKTYKLNHEIIEIDKEELEQDRQTENQIEQEQINKF